MYDNSFVVDIEVPSFFYFLFLEGFGLLRWKLETLQGVFDFVQENKYTLFKDCEKNPQTKTFHLMCIQFWKDIMM